MLGRLGAMQRVLGPAPRVVGALRGGDFAQLTFGSDLGRGQRRGRRWALRRLLLGVEQLLALIAARLRLVNLILARVVARLTAIDLGLPVGDIDRGGEVCRVHVRALVIELGLVALDLVLVAVGQRLLAIGDALVKVRQRLLLLESPLIFAALSGDLVIAHERPPLSMAASSSGAGLAM